MNKKTKTWNKEERAYKTRRNEQRVENARTFIKNIETDPKKEHRLSEQLCKVCTYVVRGAGQAFTDTNCGFCETEMMFPNTDTDALCQRCATMNEACKHCGGNMD